MLSIKGKSYNTPSPFINIPLSKKEILAGLSLPKEASFEELIQNNNDSIDLLNRIDKEAKKIHSSLKKLRESHDFSNENSPLENDIKAYDSDPEYDRYLNNNASFTKKALKTSFPLYRSLSPLKDPIEDSFEQKNQSKSLLLKENPPSRLTYANYASHTQRRSLSGSHGFTVPKPFNFEWRETNKAPSISKLRFQEYLLEREKAALTLKNYHFKAKEVPLHVKDSHLYEKLLQAELSRRKEVKKNSKVLTLQREAPFSFYFRVPKPKKTQIERKEHYIKARSIPWFCSVPLLALMEKEEEGKRRERVSKEAQRLMSMARLPSRMEKHEQEIKAKEIKGNIIDKTKDFDDRFPFKPVIRREIPDFQRLQSGFQALLDRKRSNKRTVKPIPFSFEAEKKPTKRDYLDEENEIKKKEMYEGIALKRTIMEDNWKKAAKKPKYQPPSTKKWEQAYEHRKNIKEKEAEKQLISSQKYLEERAKARKEIEARVKGSPAIVDNRKALEERNKKTLESKKKELKKTQEDYNRTLEEIKDRVRKRLLLVENYEEGSRKARKRKLMNEKKK